MKKLKILFVSILIVLISCERDDICAATTPTTPRLIVEFYDINNPDELKSVTRLTAYGEGLATDPTESNSEGIIVFNANSSSIELPLLIGNENEVTTSRFILEKDTNLRLNDNPDNTSDIDIIEVSYTTEFIYVSRACGYKSIFNNLDVDFEFVDGSSWIINVESLETVEDENTVHVRILH